MELTEAAALLKEAKLRGRTVGEGSLVTAQLPKAGRSLAAESQVILFLGEEPSREPVPVPDLSGLGYDEARELLAENGLFLRSLSPLRPDGEQRVAGQSAAAGTLLQPGEVISVTLVCTDDSILGRY